MSEVKQGRATVTLPDGLPIKDKAGKLSIRDAAREIKSYQGLGLCCQMTAQALTDNADRVSVPGLDLVQLAQAGQNAEAIEAVITDLVALLLTMKQNQLLLSADAHRLLLKALAFVRAHQKTDPRVIELFPHLLDYFAKSKSKKAPPASTSSPVLVPQASENDKKAA